jgi:hypothetical protein
MITVYKCKSKRKKIEKESEWTCSMYLIWISFPLKLQNVYTNNWSNTISVSARRRRCPSFLGVHDKAIQPATKYPQTALSMQLAPRSTQQPKYSLKRHDLHVAFALHIMGVYVRPLFLRMHMTRQTSRCCRRAPPINYQFVVRPSIRPSFLPSFAGIWQAAHVTGRVPPAINQVLLQRPYSWCVHSLLTSWG